MTTRRTEEIDICPIDLLEVDMDKCQPCVYFRGAVLYPGSKQWNVACNWPRNGSSIAAPAGCQCEECRGG